MTSGLSKLWKWLAVACLLLVLFGVLVVRPLVEQILRGAGGAISVVLHIAAEAARTLYETARGRVEASEQAKILLGEPLVSAPIEDVQWLQSAQPQIVEFEFQVRGAMGQGIVHVAATSSGQSLDISQLTLTTADGTVHDLSGD
jgi:hypothetical protein